MKKKKGKSLPSGVPFFTMAQMDWSTHCIDSTSHWEYYVYSTGRVDYQYNGCTYELSLEELKFADADDYWSGLRSRFMKSADFEELCNLLKIFPQKHATYDCCDGTGYEMTLYDTKGSIIHTTTGYIDGDETLERISELITN